VDALVADHDDGGPHLRGPAHLAAPPASVTERLPRDHSGADGSIDWWWAGRLVAVALVVLALVALT
jgi:hypothetical protein